MQISLAADQADQGIFCLDPELNFIWGNKWITQQLQLGESVKGELFVTLMKNGGATVDEIDQSALRKEGTWKKEIPFFEGQEKERVYLFHLTTTEIPDINEMLVLGTMVEITGIKQNEEKLEELNTLKNDLIKMASHDLRNPLTVILTCIDTPDMQQEEAFSLIRAQVEKMTELLTDVLDTAKEDALESIEKAPCHLSQFFSELSTEYEKVLEEKGIKLTNEFSFSNENVEIDATKVYQVVSNFLTNAKKYSGENTEVTLRASSNEKELHVEVVDHGVGIPENERDLVFTKGADASPEPTQGESTHGVGLSICKRLIEIMDGEIGLKSNENEGSTFYFTLPLSDEREAS